MRGAVQARAVQTQHRFSDLQSAGRRSGGRPNRKTTARASHTQVDLPSPVSCMPARPLHCRWHALRLRAARVQTTVHHSLHRRLGAANVLDTLVVTAAAQAHCRRVPSTGQARRHRRAARAQATSGTRGSGAQLGWWVALQRNTPIVCKTPQDTKTYSLCGARRVVMYVCTWFTHTN